jgi:hypothetical protein
VCVCASVDCENIVYGYKCGTCTTTIAREVLKKHYIEHSFDGTKVEG